MKKFFVYTFILLSCLVALNFAALFAHKKSLVMSLESLRTKLGEAGVELQYQPPKFIGYAAWSAAFKVPNIIVKTGDKYKRHCLKVDHLKTLIKPLDKSIEVILDSNPALETERSYFETQYFSYELNNPIHLFVKFDSSVDLFLRELQNSPLTKIASLSLHNTGFTSYENKGEMRELVFKTDGTNVVMHKQDVTTDAHEHNELVIKVETLDAVYNNLSSDPFNRKLAEPGHIKAKVDLRYNYVLRDATVQEKIVVKNIMLATDVFTVNVTGAGSREQTQSVPDWFFTIELENYQKMIKFYSELFNTFIRGAHQEYRLEAPSTQLVSQSEIQGLIKLVDDLPKLERINENAVKIGLIRKVGSEVKVAGMDLAELKEKLTKILDIKPGIVH